jgi:hypothetical protein
MPEKPELTSAQTVQHDNLEKCKGKTIANIEYGSGGRSSERIILHFIDGSRLTIDIGSNASDPEMKAIGLKPSDFHTDLIAKYRER